MVYGYNTCDAFYGSNHNITDPTYRFVSYVDECYTAGNCTRCALEQKDIDVCNSDRYHIVFA